MTPAGLDITDPDQVAALDATRHHFDRKIPPRYVGAVRRSLATGRAGPDEPLGFVVASTGNAAALAFAAALAPAGLHPRHFAVLRGLRGGEAQSQQELAGALGIPASRLVGLLDLLVERDLVERRDSPSDRRVKMVRLLDPGRVELDRLIELAGESEERLVAGLSEADQAELRRLLGVVYANVTDEPGSPPAHIW